MGVTLERVQNKFACIIGELCNEPYVLSQFAIWLDLRIAEYKAKGSIALDCTGTVPEPTWLKGLKPPTPVQPSPPLQRGLSTLSSRNARHKRHTYGGSQTLPPVLPPNPTADTIHIQESGVEDSDIVELIVKDEPHEVFPVSLHPHESITPDRVNSRKRVNTDEQDILNSDNSIFSTSTSPPSKSRRLSSASDNSLSVVGQDSISNQSFLSVIGVSDQPSTASTNDQTREALSTVERYEASQSSNSSFSVGENQRPSIQPSTPSTSQAATEGLPSRPRNYRSYSVAEKKRVVLEAMRTSTGETGKRLKIPRSTISTWKKQFAGGALEVKLNPGQPAYFPEAEKQIVAWILTQQEQHVRVTGACISDYALKLIDKPDFTASRGWVDNFLHRHKIVLSRLHRKKNLAKCLPKALEEKADAFYRRIEELQKERNFELDRVIAMDEVHICLDNHPAKVVRRESKADDVQDSMRNSVVVLLAVSAIGKTLPPLVIFKGKRFPSDITKMPEGIHVEMDDNGWMTEAVMTQWMDKVLQPFTGGRPTLLIMDSFKGHTTDKVMEGLAGMNVTPAVIPAGCTNKVQPINVSISEPFKTHLSQCWSKYLGHLMGTIITVTSTNRQTILEWILEAWGKIQAYPAMVEKSFYVTGISQALTKTQEEEEVQVGNVSPSQTNTSEGSADVVQKHSETAARTLRDSQQGSSTVLTQTGQLLGSSPAITQAEQLLGSSTAQTQAKQLLGSSRAPCVAHKEQLMASVTEPAVVEPILLMAPSTTPGFVEQEQLVGSSTTERALQMEQLMEPDTPPGVSEGEQSMGCGTTQDVEEQERLMAPGTSPTVAQVGRSHLSDMTRWLIEEGGFKKS